MLAFIGDVHGKFEALEALFRQVPALRDADAVIQVGDFRLRLEPHCEYVPPPRPIYWIDGNHEYFPALRGLQTPTEVYPNAIYLPRGSVLDVGGHRIACMGGAESPDRGHKIPGVNWFPEESITEADLLRLPLRQDYSLLVTHAPPAWVVSRMLCTTDVHPSARKVEALWDALGRPRCISGHMHERRSFGCVEVLDELGVLIVP